MAIKPVNGGITDLNDQRAEVERRAQELALQMLKNEVAYRIIAPIYRFAEQEKIGWDQANKEGTFPLVIEPYRVPDPNDPTNPEGYVLPTEPVMMVAGKGETANKAVAMWIKEHRHYEVEPFYPYRDFSAQLLSRYGRPVIETTVKEFENAPAGEWPEPNEE